VCGDVEIGEACRIKFGAVLVAEVRTPACRRPDLIMENAAVRA
jgi:carbonic anhydrase/acetyltransferase-like protein (isoleucine patch superfamily)